MDEFIAIGERMLYEHEGPGHNIGEDADPETGERVLTCDRCQQVLYLTSDGFPDLGGDESGLLPDVLARW